MNDGMRTPQHAEWVSALLLDDALWLLDLSRKKDWREYECEHGATVLTDPACRCASMNRMKRLYAALWGDR